MPSQTRINQISQELTRLGVEPTQLAIDAVLTILKNDNRKTVKSSCKVYAQQVNPTQKPQPTRQTTTNSTGSGGDKLQDTLSNIK